VAKEIGLSLASIPFMGVLTTPIILGEIYGYSKCYDNVRCSLHTHFEAVPGLTRAWSLRRASFFLTRYLSVILFYFLFILLFSFGGCYATHQVEEYGLPFLILTIFTFLFFTDFGIYWIHRALHSR
jgi:sterol desaturase/sphingolipid hydroxylase (fatty acid hydroxylase superfamily)